MSNAITSPDQPLYQREGAYIPRVAAVHDMCGYGKCSLGVAIPVLSAAGCDVCPVPTSLFSSHTAFPGWYMHDTTEILSDYLAAWKGIGVDIDAIYSGFLGAPEQVDRIRDLYATYPAALRVVDPVMADHGKVYPTYTPELCDAMAKLAEGADILTLGRREYHRRRGAPPDRRTACKGHQDGCPQGHPARRRAHPQLRGRAGRIVL